jgi:uracil-DNA glycosylase family 4
MKGFFSGSTLSTKTKIPSISHCGLCGRYKYCRSPKMKVAGQGSRKILVVGEAPGQTEDMEGKPFVGKAGKRLKYHLGKIGINLYKDCWITNACTCAEKENRTPSDSEIEACRPNLINTIKKYNPNCILLLGKVPFQSLLSHLWKENVGSVGRWVGYSIPCQSLNKWIITTYHPSYVMRMDNELLNRIFEKHLSLLLNKNSVPWRKVPDYKNEVELVKPSSAAKIIEHFIEKGGRAAFDYETNILKPDKEGSKIVTCSICWANKRTIAYPMENEAVEATDKFLKSPIKKIASNIKFEERWTRAIFKHRVNSWFWDTMLASHIIDNRPDITSLKFQAFSLLGMEDYNYHLESLLKETQNGFNRIHDIDMKDLLLYNGLDSLLEYKIAMLQRKQMKYEN